MVHIINGLRVQGLWRFLPLCGCLGDSCQPDFCQYSFSG